MTGGAPGVAPGRRSSLDELRRDLDACRACPLWQRATQAVPGVGDKGAAVMLVGEQPGDQEDVSGEPFVGPAGRLLDRAMAEAGMNRDQVYVTNAVKHFKWKPSTRGGKRRLHQRPNHSEVTACRPWLMGEIAAVQPKLVVGLGATAAQSLLGADWRVSEHRGEVTLGSAGVPVLATVHPSAVLRIRDANERESSFARLVDDLARAARVLNPRIGPDR
ncbi:MAG TPA: UdgX family uracil-DNA binding protein [Acidimicrobiales bacterium]|nr:UdgX family uracil-DNA binding protein [Acidimicrobiales bacterium]